MKYISTLLLLIVPLVSYGATAPTDFKSFVGLIIDLISLLIPFIIGITFLVLMWGIIQAWIMNAGDEKSVESGKKLAQVGIIAFVIMIGIWGILAILRKTFFGV